MKKIILITLILISVFGFSQTPQKINYQAVARDIAGNIVSTAIGIKFQIYQGSTSGTLVYEETHTATPSSAGIFNVAIGGGSVVSGNFSTISWGTSTYYLKVSIDPNGGTSYATVGTNQLISVPYALFAENTNPPALSVTPSGTANILSVGPNTVAIPVGSAASSPTIIGVAPVSVTPVPAVGTPTAYLIGSSTSTSTAGTTTLQINSPNTISTVTPNNYSISVAPTSITGAGVANVSGSHPNYTVNVPAPSISISSNSLTLTTGTVVSTQTFATGPWIQGSGTVALSTSSDNVVINSSSTLSKLNVGTTPGFVGNDIAISSLGNGSALQIIKAAGTAAVPAVQINNAAATSTAVLWVTNSGGSNAVGIDINISSNNPAMTAKGSGTAAAVYVTNTWSGPAVQGEKLGTSTGNAGMFNNTNSANSADALVSVTQGTGAAVAATAGTLNTSALSLLVNNGHIKSVSVSAPAVSVATNSLGFAATTSITPNSTDVKGVVTIPTNPTGVIVGGYIDISVTFNKPYASGPTVVVSQFDSSRFSYSVLSMNNTFFTVRIYNNTNVNLTVPGGFLRFSYMVIE